MFFLGFIYLLYIYITYSISISYGFEEGQSSSFLILEFLCTFTFLYKSLCFVINIYENEIRDVICYAWSKVTIYLMRRSSIIRQQISYVKCYTSYFYTITTPYYLQCVVTLISVLQYTSALKCLASSIQCYERSSYV